MENNFKISMTLDPRSPEDLKAGISLLEFMLEKCNNSGMKDIVQDKPETGEAKKTKAKPKPEAKPKDESPGISIDQVREELAKKVEDHRESIRVKLTDLGAKNVTTLDPGKYSEFVEYLKSL